MNIWPHAATCLTVGAQGKEGPAAVHALFAELVRRDGIGRLGRMFLCAWCLERTVLCNRCDHGQMYCGQSCSRAARVEAQRAAGQRYQSGGIGRINPIERTRRWRLGQKEQRGDDAQGADPVTHQDSPQAPTAEPVLSSSLSAGAEPVVTVEAAPTQWICTACAVALHPQVRLGFINRCRARASLRSGRAPPTAAQTATDLCARSLPSTSQNRALASV